MSMAFSGSRAFNLNILSGVLLLQVWCWTRKPNTVSYAVTCKFAGVYDSFEVCTKVSMYLYRSMLFDLRHCTCITMCLLPACTLY